MRIPVLEEQPSVEQRPLPTPYGEVNPAGAGGEAISNAIGEGLRTFNEAARAHEEARAHAVTIGANDNVTDYLHDKISALDGNVEGQGRDFTKTGGIDLTSATAADQSAAALSANVPTGFLSTKGKEAAAKSVPTMEWLAKRRKEIADKIQDDDVRKLFLQHSAKIYEESRGQIEAHVSLQNQVAAVESAQAREETSLLDIANNYGDAKHVEEQVKDTVAALHAVQLSPEHGAGMEQQYKAKVATTLLDLRLTDAQKTGNIEGLQQQYDAVKRWLPAQQREQYEKAIAGTGRDVHAEQLATRAVANAVQPSGRLDEQRVLDNVALIPDGPVKDEALKRARQKMMEEGQAWSTRTKEIADQAFAAFNTDGWGGIPAEVKDALNQRDPELYDRLKNEAERKWRVHGADSAEARREQAEANKIALDDFLARPAEERASLDVQNWAIGRGLNELGMGAVKVEQRKANDTVTRGDADSQRSFVDQAAAAAAPFLPAGKAGNEARAALKAEAEKAWMHLHDEHKRAPSQKEAEPEIAELTKKAMTKPGWLWGTNEEFEFRRRARLREPGALPSQPVAPAASAVPAAAPMPSTEPKVEVINEKGERGMVPAAKLDTFLAAHTGWKKR